MLKLSVLVVLFVFGYSGIVGQSLYEMISGKHAQEWGDMTALALLLLYWVACPFAYSLCNNRLGLWSTVTSSPADETEWDAQTPSASSKDSRQKTEITPIPIAETSPPSPQSPQRPSTNVHTFHHCATIMLTSLRGAQRLEGSPEESAGPGECEIYCGELPPSSISPLSITVNSSFNIPSPSQRSIPAPSIVDNNGTSHNIESIINNDDVLARSGQRLLSSELLDKSGGDRGIIIEEEREDNISDDGIGTGR
jgi:hypothetical protein